MDKKELQNLIDRISLTGPEGIKKIKKVLKELNDGNGGGGGSSSGSMGEDEEYTIAQALNDLNGRIAALENTPTPQPEMHVLEITNANASGSSSDVLAALRLDGETPTKEQLLGINISNTVVRYNVREMQITLRKYDEEADALMFGAGFVIPDEEQDQFTILILGHGTSQIMHHEI